MKSTKRTNIMHVITFTTFLSVVLLLTLHTIKSTNLDFTNTLIPNTVLCDNSITSHIPRIIDELNSTPKETDYLIEDGNINNPFIQNPIVTPEVLQLDEDMNT